MNQSQCEYTEDDPEGGLARCTRDPHERGIHVVLRQDGKRYVETIGLQEMSTWGATIGDNPLGRL